jgi:hypothetical protein
MFFAHDPGGANAVFPLINVFENLGNKVYIYAKGPAKSKILNSLDLPENIDALLYSLNPNFIITGTSSNDFTEKFLWKAAKKFNIPTMAILDHWCNYGIRFSKFGLKDIKKYNAHKIFDFFPSYICVMDEFAKLEMQKEGINHDMIYPLGNPHFENINNLYKNVNPNEIRSRFLTDGKTKIITFASEPYEEDYGISPERIALQDICKALIYYPDITLVVKLHPKELMNKYQSIQNCYFDKKTDAISMIAASDIVVSMTSMFLIEAVVLGKCALSYQPNESDKNKFILTRNGTLPFISNISELNKYISEMLIENKLMYTFEVDLMAINNIVNFVEKKLCQN